jgi:uncharacterized membrane protein
MVVDASRRGKIRDRQGRSGVRRIREAGAVAVLLTLACAEPTSPDIEGSRAVAERARARGVSFRAVGNEPGWLLELGPAAALLVWDTGAQRDTFPLPEAAAGPAGERVLETANPRHRLRIRIAAGPCHDSMSGERFAESVEIRLDADPPLRGCGGSL